MSDTGQFLSLLAPDQMTSLSRAETIARIKSLRQGEWQRLCAMQREHINEITGRDMTTAVTVASDALIAPLIDRALVAAKAPSTPWTTSGIFALGGYGRGELAPHSDIDLMVVDGGQTPWLAGFWEQFQTMLWDAGFDVGASLRHIDELPRLLADDVVTTCALIDARPLYAAPGLGQRLADLLWRVCQQRRVSFLRQRVEDMEHSRREAGESRYLLEPDVKRHPGGLRDLLFLRQIAFFEERSVDFHALRSLGTVSFDDVKEVLAAHDHLLGVRALLHFRHQRRQDTLRLIDQMALADILGYTTASRLRGVEILMRRHYRYCRQVDQTVGTVIDRLHDLGRLGRRRLLVRMRRNLDGDFSIIAGQVYLRRREFWDRDDVPARLVHMCRMVAERGLSLARALRRDIADHLYLFQGEQLDDPALAADVMAILAQVGRARPILEQMHDCGLLGVILPEFGAITCLMQFDSYHRYTVDEHSLIAIGLLDQLVRASDPERADLRAIATSLDRPELLVLALLLHDAGKIMGSGHVARGAMMVPAVCHRLGLDEAATEEVHFLVAQHLLLSDASRMRDIHDPELLARLSAIIGTPRRLDLLYLLTSCDSRAVGEGVVARWQEALLADLHDLLRQTMGVQADLPARHHGVHQALDEALGPVAAQAFLQAAPESYPYQVSPEEALIDQALLAEATAGSGAGRCLPSDGMVQVRIVVPDRRLLVADTAAAITTQGFNVIDARNWVINGYALEVFTLVHPVVDHMSDPARHQRLITAILDAAASEPGTSASRITTPNPIQISLGRPADSGFDDIEVRWDQRSSRQATVFDIRVQDRPGILACLCKVIGDHGGDLLVARVFLQGDISRDVFYVTINGTRLDDDQTQQLAQTMEDALRRLRACKPKSGFWL